MAVKKRSMSVPDKRKSTVKIVSKNKSSSINELSSNSVSNVAINKKLDLILNKLNNIQNTENIVRKSEEKLLREEENILLLEKKEIAGESVIEGNEEKEMDELKKIESLEENIKEGLKDSPLKRITYRDVTKGIIGAFFGIIGHFAFVEGTHLSEDFSVLRSTLLLITAFVIILLFLYFSGFRKVTDEFVFEFLPVRAIVIFVSSIVTVFFVLGIYGMIGPHTTFAHLYNSVAAISILAVLGAGTADLIGKNE